MASVDLIGKGKVLDYITAHPESQTFFLTLLKEFEYHPINYASHALGDGIISGSMHSGPNYVIEYQISLGLKAACLIWLGDKQEYELHVDERRKKFAATEKIKTLTVALTRSSSEVKKHSELVQQTMETVYVRTTTDANIAINENTGEGLATPANYESALINVIDNFAAKPDSTEFKELAVLIPRIKQYEARHIHFPELDLLDTIKLKMEQRGLLPEHFVSLIGKKEHADLFFSGKRMLAKGILQKLCARVGITFPITDDDMTFKERI